MPLKGTTVIELAGLAPAPLCGKFLHDFGATVIRVDKISGGEMSIVGEIGSRGKRSIALNLKSKRGCEILHRLADNADVLIEPFRKGVMEELGLGPKTLLASNPKLIYARLSGYGQYGYFSSKAGHDINYLSMSGLLSFYGWRGKHPTPPVNFSEFAGGSLMCFTGILLALIDRGKTGRGQVIDANIVEGIAYIGSWLMQAQKYLFPNSRGQNWLDGGKAFYDTYETKDGEFMAVGALEPKFYEELISKLNLSLDEAPQFSNSEETRQIFEKIFKTKTQKEWCKVFDSSDACVTPVLSIDEAANHRHNADRKTFVKYSDGSVSANRAPRLSEHTEVNVEAQIPVEGEHTMEILSALGYSEEEIEKFHDDRTVKSANSRSKL